MPSPPLEPLQETISTALRSYIQSHHVHFPVESFDLLRQLIANTPLDSQPRLKLSDIGKFDAMLESWSDKWEHGVIAVVKRLNPGQEVPGELTVVGAQVTDATTTRKRKRGEEDVKHGLFLLCQRSEVGLNGGSIDRERERYGDKAKFTLVSYHIGDVCGG